MSGKKFRLKASVLEKMKSPENKHLRNRLALALDKSVGSIERWMGSNDIMLTTQDALTVIADHLGVNKDFLCEELQDTTIVTANGR